MIDPFTQLVAHTNFVVSQNNHHLIPSMANQ